MIALNALLSLARPTFRLPRTIVIVLGLAGLWLQVQSEDFPFDPDKEVFRNATSLQDVSGGGRFYWVIFKDPPPPDAVDETWILEDEVVARGIMYQDGIESIILSPKTRYFMWAVYGDNLRVGYTEFETPRSGERFSIPRIGFSDFIDDTDDDDDALGELAEFIIGTNWNNPDTDGDGVNDGAEVLQGLNPLDGLIAATGVVGSAPTPGSAEDICASNNIVAVACGLTGVAVFNVEASDAPTRIAQVDTPGFAGALDCYGTLLAVADGSAGLAVIDISDPAGARIKLTVPLPADAVCVSTLGNFSFVGLSNGMVVSVDMFTGELLEQKTNLTGFGKVQDVGVIEHYLYVLQVGRLSVYEILDGELEFVTGISSPGGIGAGSRRLRMFLGEDFALSTFVSGFNVFDLRDLEAPVRVEDFSNTQRGWKQIVSNGDGIGIAAVSANSTNDGSHNISYFDISDPVNAVFVSEYVTPGLAAAVTLYNGLAYVADSLGGLQVINYLSFDNKGIPPNIAMFVDAPDNEIEEGKVAVVKIDTSDDVQVRNVTFFIDGLPVYTDGNYPYSFNMIAPLIADSPSRVFSIHAQAVDTGGNITETAPLLLTLIPDATPPRVRGFSPKSGSFVGKMQTVSAAFNELMGPSTLRSQSLRLFEAGLDGVMGSADDIRVSVQITYEEATMRVVLDPGSQLTPGLYQAIVQAPAADLAGNLIERRYTSTFRVFDFVDSDRDGVPDDVEGDLGLDPNNPDSDGDNIPDGLEDPDGDGLPIAGEIFLGTDPTLKDSDGDGINDGAEDTDLDGLNDGDEIRAGTDPTKIDSDGDGIDDPTELFEGFDPNDPNSRFDIYANSGVVSYVNGIIGEADGILEYTVSSGVVSYVNGIVESLEGTEIVFTVASAVVSYVNGVVATVDGEVSSYSVSSPVVSYVNGLPDTAAANVYLTSPLISYENN